MIRMTEDIQYYLINETAVHEDVAKKAFRVINDSVVPGPYGSRLYTLTYDVVLTEFGRKNWNGRIYDHDSFMTALTTNPLIKADINENGGLPSEYAHPELSKSDGLVRQMTINPQYVCALLHKYWEDGNLLKGTYTTVAGGWGDVLRDRILTGQPALVSSRCVGGVDKNGHVMPGLTVVTWDHVCRQSSQQARMIPGTVKVNTFDVPAGSTMSESAVRIDYKNDPAFKDFLLSESVSRQKICQVCDTLKLNYDTIALTENALTITGMEDNRKTTVVFPLNKLVAANMHSLW